MSWNPFKKIVKQKDMSAGTAIQSSSTVNNPKLTTGTLTGRTYPMSMNPGALQYDNNTHQMYTTDNTGTVTAIDPGEWKRLQDLYNNSHAGGATFPYTTSAWSGLLERAFTVRDLCNDKYSVPLLRDHWWNLTTEERYAVLDKRTNLPPEFIKEVWITISPVDKEKLLKKNPLLKVLAEVEPEYIQKMDKKEPDTG